MAVSIQNSTLLQLAETVEQAGGRALLVGGSVRDMLLGIESKDFDIEAYGLDLDKLEAIVSRFGKVKRAGKSFGVLKLIATDGLEIDISLPRRDSKTGPGHLGFDVLFDPRMKIEDAARRRDFTVNAILLDPLTREIIDPFGGQHDLNKKLLRVVDPKTFGDDPLRALRAMQLAARFEFSIEPENARLIRAMAPSLSELPTERVGEEWRKLLLKSKKPSVGLQLALDLGIIEALHPEFLPLLTTDQNPRYHPEGNVWNHTKMAVDQGAAIIRREKLGSSAARVVMLAVLCHDLGKPATTKIRNGRLISWGHAEAGLKPTLAFLRTQHIRPQAQKMIVNIVARHMDPLQLHMRNAIAEKNIRRLAKGLYPATIYQLLLVSEADRLGRGPFADNAVMEENQAITHSLMEKSRDLGLLMQKPEPRLSGDELLALGIPQGPGIKAAQDRAEELYNNGKTIDEIKEALKRALK